MEFDVEGHVGAVERTVSFLERDGESVSAVTLARSYATTIRDLWDAVSRAERIPRWFAPVSGQLELGGRYQVQGNAGGTITTCEPLSHFAVTWEFGGGVSWVEAHLSRAGGARLALTHTARLSPHWDTYGPGAVGVGWEMGFMGLANHIDQPAVPILDEAEFAASPEGRAYIKAVSEGWGAAAVAAGTDAETARASARRTTGFYTGQPVESG